MIWTARGKDRTGADTFLTVTPRGSFWITSHPTSGTMLWRGEGLSRSLLSIGFRSVEAAKQYVLSMFPEAVE